jgi:transposase
MGSGVKFISKPTKAQQEIFSSWIVAQREVYNAKVRESTTLQRWTTPLEEKKKIQSSEYEHIEDLKTLTGKFPKEILHAGAKRWATSWWRSIKEICLRPKEKHRWYGRQTASLAGDFFRFYSDIETRKTKLQIGEIKNPIGDLKFKAHKEYGIPKWMTLVSQAGKWHISFSYGFEKQEEGQEYAVFATQEGLLRQTQARIRDGEEITFLAVAGGLPAMDSDGTIYGINGGAKRNMDIREKRLARYRKKLSTMMKVSNRQKKLQGKIDRLNLYRTNVHRDHTQKVSSKLASHPADVLVFESVKNDKINWGNMIGDTRTQLNITSKTRAKTKGKKLLVVMDQGNGGKREDDPQKIKVRGQKAVQDDEVKIWVPKKQGCAKKSNPPIVVVPPFPAEGVVVAVGHSEFKCESKIEEVMMRRMAVIVSILAESGKTDSDPLEEALAFLGMEREAFREAVQNLCLTNNESRFKREFGELRGRGREVMEKFFPNTHFNVSSFIPIARWSNIN